MIDFFVPDNSLSNVGRIGLEIVEERRHDASPKRAFAQWAGRGYRPCKIVLEPGTLIEEFIYVVRTEGPESNRYPVHLYTERRFYRLSMLAASG